MRYIIVIATYRGVIMFYINEKILKLCAERGWTPYALSVKADITQSTLNSCLNRNSPPKIDTLQRICDAFGITLAQFFIDDESVEVLTESERALIGAYRSLSEKKQTALLEFLEK